MVGTLTVAADVLYALFVVVLLHTILKLYVQSGKNPKNSLVSATPELVETAALVALPLVETAPLYLYVEPAVVYVIKYITKYTIFDIRGPFFYSSTYKYNYI